MPSLRGVLALAVLVCLAHHAYAGDMSTDFQAKAGRGMQKGLAGGSSLGGVLAAADTFLTDIVSCGSNQSTPICKYVIYVFGCAIAGIVIMPIFWFFCCWGFCCGRNCGASCECCCKPCGQPSCGGNKPTREYPAYETWGCLAFFLPIFFVWILCFTAVGFAGFQEVPADIENMFDGIIGLVTTPADEATRVKAAVNTIGDSVKDQLDALNAPFVAGGVFTAYKTSVGNLETAYTNLRTSMYQLRNVIEGCPDGRTDAQCIATASATDANWLSKVTLAAVLDTDTPGGKCATEEWASLNIAPNANTMPMRIAVAANGAEIANPTERSPICRPANGIPDDTRGCKCFVTADRDLFTHINGMIAIVPSETDMNAIQPNIPVDDLKTKVDTTLGEFTAPLDNVASSIPIKSSDVGSVRGSINRSTIAGINVAMFLPHWLALICIIFAVILMRPGSSEAQYNHGRRCWWGSYVVGCLWWPLLCILWGFVSIISIPFEDLCDIIPQSGGTSAEIVRIMGENGQSTTQLQSVLDDCLLKKTEGYIWPIIPLQKTAIKEPLAEFKVRDKISDAQITKATDVTIITAGWTAKKDAIKAQLGTKATVKNNYKTTNDATAANRGTIYPAADKATYCAAQTTYNGIGAPADATARCNELITKFHAQIDLRADDVLAKCNAVDAAVTDLTAKAAAVKTAVNKAITDADTFVDSLVDQIWDIGKCDTLAVKYDGFALPFCRVSDSFGTFWGCLFMSIWGWFIFFFVICFSEKRMQALHGESPEPKPSQSQAAVPAAGDIAFANVASAEQPRPPAEVPKADNSMPGLDKYAAPSDVKPEITPAALPAGPPIPMPPAPVPPAPIRKTMPGVLGLQQQDDMPSAPPQFGGVPGPSGPIHTDYTPPAIESSLYPMLKDTAAIGVARGVSGQPIGMA